MKNPSISTKRNDHKFESMKFVEISCIINMIMNALNKIQITTKKNSLMMFMCSNKNFSQQIGSNTSFTVMFRSLATFVMSKTKSPSLISDL